LGGRDLCKYLPNQVTEPKLRPAILGPLPAGAIGRMFNGCSRTLLQENSYIPPAIGPDPRSSGFIGFLRATIRDPVTAIPRSAYEEPITVLSFPGAKVAYVSDPDIIDEILIKRHKDFPKSEVDERIFRPAFGDGLLLADGNDWRWKRRLAAPYFSPSALASTVPDMVAPFEALCENLRSRNSDGAVDLSKEMTKATLAVISSVLFTNQDEVDFEGISRAITDYLTPISWTIGLAILQAPGWLPHPGKGRIRRGKSKMRELVNDLIDARRKSNIAYEDICADLMHAEDPETGQPLSDDDLADMLLTLVAAGHETSANGLTWALYCLANQAQLQEELRAEVESIVGDRPVAASDLASLVKIEAFLKESMRLFPPAPLMGRRNAKAEQFGDHEFKPGSNFIIPIYAVHRHRLLWPSPDQFDLTRFTGKAAREIRRTAYMPFGGGPRICIGNTFALMEMVSGFATMIRHLRFSTTGATRCEPIQRVTLRPKDNLQLAVSNI
jgi:cytochrome P450